MLRRLSNQNKRVPVANLDLGPIKETLRELKSEIHLEKQRTPFNPQKIEACSWIFSSTDYAFFQGTFYVF